MYIMKNLIFFDGMTERVTNNVYEFRSAKRMTQEELGHAVGVTRQTIIAIEKGNYTPSVLLALKLGRFFKVPVEDVFVYETAD